MDRIHKALKKLNAKEQKLFKQLLLRVEAQNLKNLDVKKLKGRKDIFRIRKGSLRIIYKKHKDTIFILTLERRTGTTYKKL